MSGLKYTLVVVFLLLILVAASPGCSLLFPEKAGDTLDTDNTTYEIPGLQYGDGEPLVSLIPADFTPVVEAVAPAVVRIVTQTTTYWFWQPIPQTGVGTGVLYSSDGYVLTNKHVVEGVESITVYLSNSTQGFAVGKRPWLAPDTDLAVLKIDGTGFPAAEFIPGEEISAYQWVIAIGYPFNIGGAPTVSEGIISALGRAIRIDGGTVLHDVIQTTAAINPGNSGGPLVDLSGRVVGINTAKVEAENIGFAISAIAIEEFIQNLASS